MYNVQESKDAVDFLGWERKKRGKGVKKLYYARSAYTLLISGKDLKQKT